MAIDHIPPEKNTNGEPAARHFKKQVVFLTNALSGALILLAMLVGAPRGEGKRLHNDGKMIIFNG
jgi:hypothetical protein